MFLIPASSLQLIWSPTAQSRAWCPPLLGAGFLYRILSPTGSISNWLTSCLHPGYIIIQRPLSSCGRHKSHSINPSTVKVISWYSSTGCTCYLFTCISYFDSLAGSEVNMQHYLTLIIQININDLFGKVKWFQISLSNNKNSKNINPFCLHTSIPI